MFLLQSIIVYGLIIWVMIYFGNIAYKNQYPQGIDGVDKFRNRKISFATLLTKRYFFIPIFIFSFFAAIRFRDGAVCESDNMLFYEINSIAGLESRDIEPAFLFVTYITSAISGKHYLFMFVMAFLQIVFLYYAQRKTTYSLRFFGLTLFLSGVFFSLLNGMRQYISTCVFVALVPLVLEKKKWVWYIIGTIFAMQMHKTAFLMFPLGIIAYFLQYKIPNRKIQLGVIAGCFILMDSLNVSSIINLFSIYGSNAGYDDRAIDIYSNVEMMNKAFGLRSFLLLASYIITVWYSEKMQGLFNSKVFNIQYNLFFIGICLHLLFYNNFVLGRLLYYFLIFIPIVISTTLFYLKNSRNSFNKKFMFKLLIWILVVRFFYELYDAYQNLPFESSLYKFDLL